MTMIINNPAAPAFAGGVGDLSDVVRQIADASPTLKPYLSAFMQMNDTNAEPYRIANRQVHGANQDGLFDANGAPALPPPISAANIDALVMLAQLSNDQANDKMLSQQATDVYTGTKQRVDDYVSAQLKSIEEFKAKVAAAAKKGVAAKIFGWISKHLAPVLTVLSLVVAAAVTVATGGLAAPLLVLAVVNLAGVGLQLGGISISEKLSNLITKALSAVGVPKEQAEKIGNVVGGCIVTMIPGLLLMDPAAVGRVFRGVGELSGADKNTAQWLQMIGEVVGTILGAAINIVVSFGTGAGNAIGLASSRIADVAKYAQIGTTAANGVIGMGSGASNIVVSVAQKDIQMAEADRRLIQQLTDDVRGCFEEVQDTFKRAFDHVLTNCKASAEMVAQHVEAMTERASQPIPA